MKQTLQVISVIFGLFLATSRAYAIDVFGIVDHTSPSGIALSNHEIYGWADAKNLVVDLLGESAGGLSNIRKGDSVQLILNSRHLVREVRILPKDVSEVVPVSAFTQPTTGKDDWGGNASDNTIGGRPFDISIGSRLIYSKITTTLSFRNINHFNLFDVFVGVHERQEPNASALRFTILGDDDVLYQTRYLTCLDRSVHIRADVSRYSGITIQVDTNGKEVEARAVVAEPNFYRLPITVPVLTGPEPEARIAEDTDLNWNKVDGADAYILELQCIEPKNPADAASLDRFSYIRLAGDKTSYTFSPSKLPTGKWRWRVHSLKERRIFGEMGLWRYFLSQ